MHVTIYRTRIESLIEQNSLQQLLSQLPASLRAKANRYKSEISAYQYVVGRLLLRRGLKSFDIDNDLDKIEFKENGKPVLPEIHFNISHSGHQVICAFSKDALLGVDIEKIKAIDFADFSSIFSDKEWTAIQGADDPLRSFYWFWTRKESIIKALGRNLTYLHQIELDVTSDQFVADGHRWFLHDLEVGEGYLGALCCEEEIREVKVEEVKF